MDKASGKPKGTAFVEYETEAGAKKAADACARGRCALPPPLAFASLAGLKRSDPLLACACDPTHLWPHGGGRVCARRASKGPGVQVGGRTLDVDLAVSQEQARQLAVEKVSSPELHCARPLARPTP